MALILGILYTLPNFFGESPAIQVTSTNVTRKVDENTLRQVESLLQREQIPYTGAYYSVNNSIGNVRVRFESPDIQLRAKDTIEKALINNPEEPEYTVALNLLSDSPDWLTAINARPMFLGLDLRGGVHFLLQVDMDGALESRYDTLSNDVRNNLRTRDIESLQVSREGSSIQAMFSTATERDQALSQLRGMMPELSFNTQDRGDQYLLIGEINESEIVRIQETALRQNIITLHNRINELGVAEPVIQQQGNDRIVVQLPGIQDVARAKEILGRTATLQLRLVEDSPSAMAAIASGTVPFGMEAFQDTNGQTILLRRQVLLTGENLQDARAGRNPQTQQPTVNLSLDDNGARIFRETTRNNIGKRIAIVLFENNRGQVVTAPVIRSEIPNGQVEISGSMSLPEAADTALLLRAGSLAAPMSIIEERTIGPSLGAENIEKGFNSTLWGFVAIAIFMIIYYHLFGIFSTLGLVFNLVLLLSLLSVLQATLTLPGIAAIALTLGMAIDANVLINERIREELRGGATPQQAINTGFDRAWGTIFDSNLTSLIVGIALLAFSGPGPIRGFAIVHCLGILTSMFSSIVGVRALVNLCYGGRRGLKTLAIGTIWRPDAEEAAKSKNKRSKTQKVETSAKES